MSEFETDCMDEIVCPYCGNVASESYEYRESDGEYECGECEKVSVLSVHVSVTYSTLTREAWHQERADIAGRIADERTGEVRERWLEEQKHHQAQLEELRGGEQ